MRASLLILVLAASGLSAQENAAVVDRNAAYEKVRDTERFTKLIEKVGERIDENDPEAALEAATLAVELQPENPVALNAQAASLIELGRHEDAAKAIDAALAASPDYMPALFNRAESLFLQRKYSDAAVQFRLLNGKPPVIPLVKFKLYLSYHFSGRDDLAQATLAALRFPSDGPAWYFTHAADRLIANDKAGAKGQFKAGDAIYPKESRRFRDALKDSGVLK